MKKIQVGAGIDPIEILFEDKNFLGVCKPDGLVVHATVDKQRANLYDLLKANYSSEYLGLHHRLDVQTSGAMLFTKNEEVNPFVQEGFKTHSIIKKYWAIVHGRVDVDLRYEDFLKAKKIKNKEVMEKVLKGGVKAISLVKTIKASESLSLLEFTLLTGRMHQIRVQSKIRNHPILGDALYGDESLDKKLKPARMFLHSRSLEFTYQDQTIRIEAPVDSHFQKLIDQL